MFLAMRSRRRINDHVIWKYEKMCLPALKLVWDRPSSNLQRYLFTLPKIFLHYLSVVTLYESNKSKKYDLEYCQEHCPLHLYMSL